MRESASPRAEALLLRAQRAFQDRFGRKPRYTGTAPGRVNLIGEHTDYNDGFVLPFAIDRHTVILASRAASDVSTLWACDLDRVERVDVNGELPAIAGSFANYVLAVVQQFRHRFGEIPNLDLLITGDLPRGAGLSSSASLEIAIAGVLEQAMNVTLEPVAKALLCQWAERDFVGVPCGIMDMLAIALARPRHAMFLDCRSLRHELVPLPDPSETTLLVADTGTQRALASGAYAQRRRTCESAAGKLGVPALRDADVRLIDDCSTLTDDERRMARHVVSENERVLDAVAALRAGDLNCLGDLMFASHNSLREDFQVSTPELDALVDTARSLRDETGGVFGARLTGAGLGGCALVLCRAATADHVSEHIAAEYHGRFGRRLVLFEV